MSGIDKWSAINQTMNKKRIAILALQEMHLDLACLHDVVSCFRRRLEIVISQHPENPCTAASVAFIINKALINPREYKMYKLQQGCAAALKIKWLEDDEIMMYNVYASNAKEENAEFWEMIDIK